MATAELTPAVPAYAPPMARPGYGKKSAPDQAPRRAGDFAHLPEREASIAAHIDRLPDGAAVDIKTLARELAAYGQQAVAKALENLSKAGHLRRFREQIGTQWVTRTHFSRTARDDAWWSHYLKHDTAPPPARTASRTEAYEALAAVGRTAPRMTLSAAECAQLEPLATEWLARGATREQLIAALTGGLPEQVHSPGALARRRLTDKLPPEQPVRPSTRIMECTACGVPGYPEALPGGLCRQCRGEERRLETPDKADAVRAQAARVRAGIRTRPSALPHPAPHPAPSALVR
ncbi:hypothetical protein LKL35_04180 [Streptomyces sp. ET3-23]|uniref:hypothetical protein n=1 Tax=Streptomyces sp. ET3-23 TaxID=2885643 RepID=UPI001D10CC3A|nr:hypothetical protein [Streptomyces sp. ET3-23]MCC2274639.1 hypothetical protein [Streptomyces sp. ET3-23]